MLEQLRLVEQELPTLLNHPGLWQSLFVNYEKPFVERLWCPGNGYRINLHRITPCEANECFFHPHPWPSAMKIIFGIYQMKVGYGSGVIAPPTATTVNLAPGSTYEMADFDSWHSVRPIDLPVYSVMLTGKPWKREMPPSDHITLSSLPDHKVKEILSVFKEYYY
jgi:hypothetical protein